MDENGFPYDKKLEEKFNKIYEKISKEPYFTEQQELGKLLMINYNDLSKEQLERYNYLLKFLEDKLT